MSKSSPEPVRSFLPIADDRARVLILGSMPGAASLVAGQYYAHPRNAFWPIMGALFGAGPELAYEDRRQKLQAAGVAVWDVLRECVRPGSLDADIRAASEAPNQVSELLAACPRLTGVLFNGQKAADAFRRHVQPTLAESVARRVRLVRVPSTSPAHASLTVEQKIAAWRQAVGEVDRRE